MSAPPAEHSERSVSTANSNHQAPPPPVASLPSDEARVPLAGLKNGLLRIVEISALGFLEPLVRLCWAEEPRVQLKKLGRFVLVPVLAFVVFLAAWAILAPLHQTRSGSMPTPGVVSAAFADIMTIHRREVEKERAYTLPLERREQEQQRINQHLGVVESQRAKARAKVEELEAEHRETIAATMEPLQAAFRERRLADRDARRKREAELEALAGTIPQAELVSKIHKHEAWVEANREEHRAMRDAMDAASNAPAPALDHARIELTRLANEESHLRSLLGILEENNREYRAAKAQEEVDQAEARLAEAEGADRYLAANAVMAAQTRVERISSSQPPMAFTLPRQILRSIFCVFVGFLIGTLIAVPIGICCGLSPTFMAAMTPFIALFKPVSPIVWLLVFLIIVVGFIPDSDSHWLTSFANSLPLIGWMEINPAFIASAITVAMCSLWATMVNTALGVASVDKDHINVARVLRLGFWKRLRTIILPSALPLMFAGMRISLGVGWMVLIAAELLSNSEGIGKFVWDQFNNGAADSFAKIVVCVFVVGIIGLILDRIMIVFQRLVSFEGSVASV